MPATRWMAIADSHGDMQDDGAVKVARDFMRFWKPKIRIHLGDAFDLRCLRKGASEGEQSEAIKADIECGLDLLSWYQPTVFLRGNHDERLWDGLTDTNGFVRDFCGELVQDILKTLGKKCQVFPYCKRTGIFRMGHAKFCHGFGNGGLYAARNAALVYNNIFMGHFHTVETYNAPGLEPREGRIVGSLCKLDMVYNRAHMNTLRQCHGFAYGFLNECGTYDAFQARGIEGRWLMPTEFKEVYA